MSAAQANYVSRTTPPKQPPYLTHIQTSPCARNTCVRRRGGAGGGARTFLVVLWFPSVLIWKHQRLHLELDTAVGFPSRGRLELGWGQIQLGTSYEYSAITTGHLSTSFSFPHLVRLFPRHVAVGPRCPTSTATRNSFRTPCPRRLPALWLCLHPSVFVSVSAPVCLSDLMHSPAAMR